MKRALSLVFILILLLSISSTVFSETGQFNAVYLTKIYFNQWNKDDETRAMYAAHFFMDAELYAIKQGEKTASKYLDIIISAVELNHIEFSTEKCQIGFSCKDGNSLLLMYPMNPTLIVGHIKAKGEIECFMNYDSIHLC